MFLEITRFHPISTVNLGRGDYEDSSVSSFVQLMENGVKEFAPYHPYFTLISLLLKAASKSCTRAKNRESKAMKGR